MQRMVKDSLKVAYFLLFCLLCRMAAMLVFPLTDTTEARYGEIARKMVETGDWITPQHDYGVPFWGKPPLSTWASALGMEIFGVNEFGARFFSLLFAAATVALVYKLAKEYLSELGCLCVLMVLSTMGMFYASAGAVMTDAALAFACTLVMAGFWYGVEKESRAGWYVLFAGLGIGLITKGPVVWVLTGSSAFLWLFWAKKWNVLLKKTPMVSGTLLTVLIGVPWYILAEHKTPGFLQYFIVGENFNRFLVPSWSGDLYGRAHSEPLGKIWLFFIINASPWLLPVLVKAGMQLKKVTVLANADTMTKYLLCWMLTPLVFFTFAHNIIVTYPLVALPPLALLLVKYVEGWMVREGRVRPWVYAMGALTPLMAAALLGVVPFKPEAVRSAKFVTEAFYKLDNGAGHEMLYASTRVFSMEFYTQGKLHRFDEVPQAITYGREHNQPYIILTEIQLSLLSPDVVKQLSFAAKAAPDYLIYKINSVDATAKAKS